MELTAVQCYGQHNPYWFQKGFKESSLTPYPQSTLCAWWEEMLKNFKNLKHLF